MSAMYEKASQIFNIDSRFFLKQYRNDFGIAALAVVAAALFLFLAWLSGDYAFFSGDKHPIIILVAILGCALALSCAWLAGYFAYLSAVEGFGMAWYNARHYGNWDCGERRPKPASA